MSPRPDGSGEPAEARGSRHPRVVADPGLQAERTYLAWQRTGLAFAAVGALLLHVSSQQANRWGDVPGLFGLIVGASILAFALLRYRTSVAAARGERSTAAGKLIRWVGVAATLLSVSGLVIVMISL